MITLTRRQVHDLRAVFRPSTLGVGRRSHSTLLALRAEGTQLFLEHRGDGLGVRYALPGAYRPIESIVLPLDALAEAEGRDPSPVNIEAAAHDQTVVRWHDRGIPQVREYTVPAVTSIALLPEPSGGWTSCPATLLDALVEAGQTCDEHSTRYALGCVQLRGASGEVIATDGRQLLVQRGYRFPWDGDVLVRRTPLFASRALPRDRPIALARAEKHVLLRAGNWMIALDIRSDARFPDVAHVVPADGSDTSRVIFDPADAAYLADAIERLPGADMANAPVTIDVNGRVAVRARDPEHDRTTEVVLARSRSSGTALRVSSNRDLLARALRLGFGELLIADVESPVWCRDGRRTFAWQPLDKGSVIEPAADVIRIESCPTGPGAAARHERAPRTDGAIAEGPSPVRNGAKSHADSVGMSPIKAASAATAQAAMEDGGPVGLTGLIRETEALHQALSDAKRRTARLIAALRRQKKRDRLVASTLTALKELDLQGVSE
jgi:hypothetical protein